MTANILITTAIKLFHRLRTQKALTPEGASA